VRGGKKTSSDDPNAPAQSTQKPFAWQGEATPRLQQGPECHLRSQQGSRQPPAEILLHQYFCVTPALPPSARRRCAHFVVYVPLYRVLGLTCNITTARNTATKHIHDLGGVEGDVFVPHAVIAADARAHVAKRDRVTQDAIVPRVAVAAHVFGVLRRSSGPVQLVERESEVASADLVLSPCVGSGVGKEGKGIKGANRYTTHFGDGRLVGAVDRAGSRGKGRGRC